MFIAKTISEIRIARATLSGTVAFVPTMGALHAGHVHLIHEARKHAANVVVSVFVNPTQFGPNEDFSRYPRPIERDLELCRQAGVMGVFNPTPEVMYPPAATGSTVSIPSLANVLEGAHRPGHFDGVCRVVAKLFNLVQPDAALFGMKDYQQLCVIRAMVGDLNMAVKLVPVETVREPDGLAMSSRNVFLTTEERKRAVGLHAALCAGRELITAGESKLEPVETTLRHVIEKHGIEVNYAAVRDADTMGEIGRIEPGKAVVMVVAGKLGTVRLLDNAVAVFGG